MSMKKENEMASLHRAKMISIRWLSVCRWATNFLVVWNRDKGRELLQWSTGMEDIITVLRSDGMIS